jgi:mRNA-degrading endonuclease RelE of RelBE toxin-antitoxin system
MDKISKALTKLSLKEQIVIKNILLKIKDNSLVGFDLKKLKSRDDIFRVRKGSLRILFKKEKKGQINILALERRSDNTYN